MKEEKKRFVFLYGFNKSHELRDVKFMINQDISIKNTVKMMNIMLFRNPDVFEIYAMDGSYELKLAYQELCKTQHKDFTQILSFWDYISKSGLKLK